MNPNYFCTYYKLDYGNSVIDDRPYVQSGNYHLVDEKSGRVWKKIHLMPLWTVEAHGPINYKASEDGITREAITSFIIPDYLGVRPTSRDFVHIYDKISNKTSNDQPLFMVQNRSESQLGTRKIYKIDCKNSYHKISELEVPENISSEWIYVNYFRKIYAYDIGVSILNTLSKNYELLDKLTKDETSNFAYDSNVCMFNVK